MFSGQSDWRIDQFRYMLCHLKWAWEEREKKQVLIKSVFVLDAELGTVAQLPPLKSLLSGVD